MSKKLIVGGSAVACSIPVIIGMVATIYGDEIRTSERGMVIIGNAEGCRRDPYHCPAGVLTVGVGSTQYSGEKIDPKKTYTDEEIAHRWAADIKIAENCVNRYGNGNSLPDSVFDAMTSITFNVGCGKMKRSTMYLKANYRQYDQVCAEFSKWVYAGGKKLPGLVNRREKEKALCLSDLKRP